MANRDSEDRQVTGGERYEISIKPGAALPPGRYDSNRITRRVKPNRSHSSLSWYKAED